MYSREELAIKQRKRVWLYVISFILLFILIGIFIPETQIYLSKFASPFLIGFFKTAYPEKYYTKQQKRCQVFAFVFGISCLVIIISKLEYYFPGFAHKKIENLVDGYLMLIPFVGLMAFFTVIGYKIAKYISKRFFLEYDPHFKPKR